METFNVGRRISSPHLGDTPSADKLFLHNFRESFSICLDYERPFFLSLPPPRRRNFFVCVCVDGHLISVTQKLLTPCVHVSDTFPWLTGQPRRMQKRENRTDKTRRSGRCTRGAGLSNVGRTAPPAAQHGLRMCSMEQFS